MTPGRTGQADCTFKPTKTNSDVVCACGAGVQKTTGVHNIAVGGFVRLNIFSVCMHTENLGKLPSQKTLKSVVQFVPL